LFHKRSSFLAIAQNPVCVGISAATIFTIFAIAVVQAKAR